jgi:hypothetical protein
MQRRRQGKKRGGKTTTESSRMLQHAITNSRDTQDKAQRETHTRGFWRLPGHRKSATWSHNRAELRTSAAPQRHFSRPPFSTCSQVARTAHINKKTAEWQSERPAISHVSCAPPKVTVKPGVRGAKVSHSLSLPRLKAMRFPLSQPTKRKSNMSAHASASNAPLAAAYCSDAHHRSLEADLLQI